MPSIRLSAASVPSNVPPASSRTTGYVRSSNHVAGDDDVGLPEEHEHVAIARRRRHVDDLDRLLIEIELARAAEERVARQVADPALHQSPFEAPSSRAQ